MAIPSRLMGSGMSAQAATNIAGDLNDTLTATGSTITDALQLSAASNILSTVAASTGARLPPAEKGAIIYVKNLGAQTLTVYPQSASGKINAGSVGDGVSVAAAAAQWFVARNNLDWVCNA